MEKEGHTMVLGSPTCMQSRIMERAINKVRTSPMTGIAPMTADQPIRNPQQQHVNERSKLDREEAGSTHSISSSSNLFKDFGIFFGKARRDRLFLWLRLVVLLSDFILKEFYSWSIFRSFKVWIISLEIVACFVSYESNYHQQNWLKDVPLCEECGNAGGHFVELTAMANVSLYIYLILIVFPLSPSPRLSLL
jgi:hypothetical protein